MDNNNNPDGLNYRSFSKRESNTDYSRWSLLRQADKNSSFKVASGSEKASTPSGIFSSKTRNQENVLLDNEERFAPSSTHIEKISIQDMLSSKKVLADKNETRSGLNSALWGNAVTTSKPNSALPKTGDGASSARGYSGSDTDGKGHVNTTAISSHCAEAILKSRSFDYAVSSSDRGSPAHASSIARTLKNNASPTSSYAHDNTFLRANMNSADLRYEEGRLRSAADQAFKNAATLEQLKNAEQSAQAVSSLRNSAYNTKVPDESAGADRNGHKIFTKKREGSSSLLSRISKSMFSDRQVEWNYAYDDERPASQNPARHSQNPVSSGSQYNKNAMAMPGRTRFEGLFDVSARNSRGKRRESLKDIYRRIEQCQ